MAAYPRFQATQFDRTLDPARLSELTHGEVAVLDPTEVFDRDGHASGFQVTSLGRRPNRQKESPAPWWVINQRAFLQFGRFLLNPDKKNERDMRRRARWHHALRNLVILRLAYSVGIADSEIAVELQMTEAAVKARRRRMLAEGERYFASAK